MSSLRHIKLWEGYMIHPDLPVSHMPWGLEELKSLQSLSHFFVGKEKVGCLLNGLNGLKNLEGSLEIRNLENVKNAEESKETNLKTKRKLQRLGLVWVEPDEDDIIRAAVGFEVLENLEPPSALKILKIDGYVGTRFPRWMMEASSSLPNVVEIGLWECRKCEILPSFSHLPSLKILRLWGMDGLQCIEDRPKENHKESWLISLTRLEIVNCRNLESWFPMESQVLSLPISFPSLVVLKIHYCLKLKNIPPLPSIIEELALQDTNAELVQSLVLNPNSSLYSLTIQRCEGLESWPNWLGPHLTLLRELEIGCTQSLPFLPQQIQHLPALQSLVISDYCEEALPEWMASITPLQYLIITNCKNLQILPEWVLTVNTTIKYLQIIGCSHLAHRYNKETGEDRHKIAHIKYTALNYKRHHSIR